jgi:hypothetical protein
MLEFIKNCFKYFSRNSITPEEPTKVTEESKKIDEKFIISQVSGMYSISESSENDSFDASSEEFDDEKYAIATINKLIKQQRKILKDINEGKVEINRFTYITLKTNRENFTNILKDIKSKDERDKYTYIYYRDFNKFKNIAP